MEETKSNINVKCIICGVNIKIEKNQYIRKTCTKKCKSIYLSTKLKGIKKSKETIEKISKTLKTKYSSGEIVSWCKGTIGIIKAWNKGLTKKTDERLRKLGENTSKTRKEKLKIGDIKIWNKNKIGSQRAWNKGLTKETDSRLRKSSEKQKNIKKSKEQKDKISKTLKIKYFSGKIAVWNKGKNKDTNAAVFEISKKLSNYYSGKTYEKLYGKEKSDKIKKKISKSHKGKKLTPEHIKNFLRRRNMSSLEIKMNNIILKNNLPYKFVGNGEFVIENKCPDFINTNGEKILIEVYFTGHKNKFKKDGVEIWKKEREEIFQKSGYETIFISETQVKEENILNILTNKNKE